MESKTKLILKLKDTLKTETKNEVKLKTDLTKAKNRFDAKVRREQKDMYNKLNQRNNTLMEMDNQLYGYLEAKESLAEGIVAQKTHAEKKNM